MSRIATQSDCSKCAALCCIAYPSDDMPGFAAEKGSGEPCPKLDSCGNCTIYPDRERLGFAGCIAYECFGAGQFVTQSILAVDDRSENPRTKQAMVDSFLRLRPAFDLLFLAQRLEPKDLSDDGARERSSLIEALEDALLTASPVDVERALPDARARLRALYSA